jgi:hypothetical protein
MKVKIGQMWTFYDINTEICYIYKIEKEDIGMKVDYYRDWDYKSAFDGKVYMPYTDIFLI